MALSVSDLQDLTDRIDGRIAHLEGWVLETRFSINIPNWTRQWVRRGVRVYIDDIPELADASGAGKLTEAEVQSLALADSLVRGADTETGDDTYVTVELSATIHVADVERAEQRARLLKRAGLRARPVVGGYRITPEGEESARLRGVDVALWRAPS